jgi:acyl-CoA synthetase (AMP-forming)/AMP-acid ligase II
MRLSADAFVEADPDAIWDVVTDPHEQTALIEDVTRWDVEGDLERGLGARYVMRMRVGSAEIGSTIEVVEWDEARDMAWSSVKGIDQRGRWRLRRDDRRGGTHVELRLSYQSPGSSLLGAVADRVSARLIQDKLDESVKRLKRRMEGEGSMGDDSPGIFGKATTVIGQGAHSVRTLAEAGLIKPQRPDRTVRALIAMQRWGFTPAAGYAANAARYPNDDAIVDELGHLSFKEVHERTNRLAHAWMDDGLGEGDTVAIMCRNHRGFIEATVAASKLGMNCLYLNTAFAGPQLTEVVQREKPDAIVFDEEFYELLEDAGKRRKRYVSWFDSEIGDLPDETVESVIDRGDPADPTPPAVSGKAIILTSGTTGTPKGASRRQPETIGPAVALLSRIPLKAREKTFIVAPLFHSWGFAHFTLGLMLGSTYVLHRKFKPEETLSLIAQHQAQSAPMVPVMVQRIMELPEEIRTKYDLSSLKSIPLSGSALPGELAVKFMDEFGDKLYNLYGSTEVAWATIATPADLRAAPGTAGAPPRGTVVKIYDDKGREQPTGENGRIFVGNEMLFEGYTGGGKKDVIDGLMATGDVGYMDEENRLFVSGRDDEMIVSGGENVFPREVEDTIANLSGVDEVAVIGVEDEKFGQALKAFVVTGGSGSVSEDDVKRHVKSNLANFKVPKTVEFLDELPRNATGKVLKKELKEKEEETTA